MADKSLLLQYYKYLLLVAIGFLLFIRSWKRRKDERQIANEHGCEPLKSWKSDWPLGFDLLVKAFRYNRQDRIMQFFLSVIEASGTTFEQNLLGTRGIDTIDPENIETILSTKFQDFGLGLRPPTFHPLLGSGIFTQDGVAWRYSRDLLRPQFMSNRSQNFEQVKECVENLIQSIPLDGVIDLQPLFFRLTFDTTTYLLFGRSMSALASKAVAGRESKFANAFNLGQDYLAERGRLGNFYWLWNDGAFRKACRTCHEFVDEAVQEALRDTQEEANQKFYVFIHALIKETRDPKVLRDQCMNILLAGRDTTACCLSWTFRLLARHPKVLEKLRTEIETTVGIGHDALEPTRNDLKKMSYLSLVIKEVLRLYPSVPVNSRAAVRTTVLPVGGGKDGKSPILVRRGEAVGYCVYAMHRRKDIYGDDAKDFRPERWEGDALREVGWGYLPFNGGPRMCLGQEFALLEASYATVRIIQKFPKIELARSEWNAAVGDERQTLTLVIASASGCNVVLKQL